MAAPASRAGNAARKVPEARTPHGSASNARHKATPGAYHSTASAAISRDTPEASDSSYRPADSPPSVGSVKRARAELGGGERGLDHGNARVRQGCARFVENLGRERVQQMRALVREHGRAFDRCGADLHDHVARPGTAGSNERPVGPKAQHLADDHRPGDRVRHLRMPAEKRGAGARQCLVHGGEQTADVVGGRPDGQHDRTQEPARADARDRDVVGVDDDRVGGDVVARQRDGVGGGDEGARFHADGPRVFARRRAQQDLGRRRGAPIEQLAQKRARKLSGPERLIRHRGASAAGVARKRRRDEARLPMAQPFPKHVRETVEYSMTPRA